MPPLDPFVPAERFVQRELARLPAPLSRFLGYRAKNVPPLPMYIVCFWGFIGAFGGLGVIFAVFAHTNYFTSRNVPVVIASYGASAILCYGAIDTPLAQPRALIFGHFFSAVIGIVVAIIFGFDLETNVAPRLQWLAASLATAIALVVMHATKTTHPPAGATALLPCIDTAVWSLKWYFLPVVLLSSTLVLMSALLVNNVQRQYPKFWITPIPPPQEHQSKQHRHRTAPPETIETAQSLRRSPADLRDLQSA
ncbi:hypothetical protein K504DRAFT_370532 [Pleomassaria siparia CBS 279.74]|uniref:HPP transmembrane region domain-containing protein n=1 Tax=Pleomassaria siparia CBS 279.74 TaxID=1314801 RepID=A0A6G1KN76_9PLEO|nr:hypothetical protein K504DRAFT_370532 [Pleomassaria siparia CBS 279.74]